MCALTLWSPFNRKGSEMAAAYRTARDPGLT